MKIRCFDTATQIFRLIDTSDLPSLEIETDALRALRRVREGEGDFIFAHEGVEVPLDDVAMLEIVAAWQQSGSIAA